MSNPQQLKTIHAIKRDLGMSQNEYYSLLEDAFKVRSSSDLTPQQADEFIATLRRMQGQGNPTGRGINPHMHLDNRPGFASASQIGHIEGRWSAIARARDKRSALENFLRRKFQINGLSWIRDTDVQRILRAIAAMEQQAKTLATKKAGGRDAK